jgi:hypothetical protein
MFASIAVGSAFAATCSNATLNGVWGVFVGAAVGQFTADGNGNVTGSSTVSNNGAIETQTYTGTYSISKNCTGSLTTNFTGGGTGHNNFVVDDSKKGAQVINTDRGHAASGFALAEGVVTCGLTGKKATFAANLIGNILGTGPIAYVFQVTLDGKGNVSSGSGTFDVSGKYVTAPSITGTYAENADCTGTMQITPSGFGKLNFDSVVVNAGKEILVIETDAGTVIGDTCSSRRGIERSAPHIDAMCGCTLYRFQFSALPKKDPKAWFRLSREQHNLSSYEKTIDVPKI